MAMLEAVIPAVLSAVHGWFTPAVLFVVLNIVIGTIAVTSKVAASAGAAGGDGEGGGDWGRGGGGGGGGERRGLSRVPSMALDRLRSFNLSSRFAASAPEPAMVGVMDLGLHGEAEAEAAVVKEVEQEEHAEAHMERSRSEAAAEVPRLPARLRKSASDRSVFAHFEEEKAAAAEEARRPATTREAPRVWLRVSDDGDGVSEPESGDEADADDEADAGAGEVDARADDFINKFRHQLKLQRIDSYLRHRDMLRRGHAAAAAAAVGSD